MERAAGMGPGLATVTRRHRVRAFTISTHSHQDYPEQRMGRDGKRKQV